MPAPVRLVTCADLPEGDDEDGALLLAACRRIGLDAAWVVWDDPATRWEEPGRTVVRSTWDYTARRAEFLDWAGRTPHLDNPAPVIRWNSDKRYLGGLAAAGLPIVPTQWADLGAAAQWPAGEFVVKPTVGAGSLGAGRFAADDHAAAAAHLDRLHAAGRAAMVQPYLEAVDTAGETALVFIDGAFSHAIRKAPMLAPGTVHDVHRSTSRSLFVPERITAREPSPAELAVADATLAAAQDLLGRTEPLLYARVDLLPGADGPVLIELELTEPSLFLSFAPEAADRLATAIARRMPGARTGDTDRIDGPDEAGRQRTDG